MGLKSVVWRALMAISLLGILVSCSNSGPSTEPPSPTTIDSFGAAPNPVPANVAALFSWTVYGSNLVCKLDVEGDGTVDYTVTGCSSQSRVAHTYGEVGIFNARLTVTGADGETQQKTTRVATSGPNTPPSIPEFKSGVPASTSNPLAVNFNWVVADRDSDVTYCRFDAESDGKWEFSGLCSGLAATSGEVKGASSTGFSLIHPYTKPGRYEATLEAADPYEVVSSKVKVRAPWNRPPQIDNFKTTATGDNAGQVVFKVSDPDDDSLECILKVQSIGTFRYNNCRQLTRNFTFPDSGTFTISLEVTDTYGAVSRRSTTLSFVPPPPPPVIAKLELGSSTSCALSEDGRAYCWGDNSSGQLGINPATSTSNAPVQITGSPSGSKWVEISTGSAHTCGLRDDQSAWCWGNNDYGQLGNNTTADSFKPVLVAGGKSFSQISAGAYFTCGVTTSQAVFCWGINSYGNLGTNTTTDSLVPTALNGGDTYQALSAGYNFACGLLVNKTIKCWGWNAEGELGDGTGDGTGNYPFVYPDIVLAPVTVAGSPTGTGWTGISAGKTSACGLRDNGSAWCWGNNGYRQLGLGTSVNSPDLDFKNTPQAVAAGSATGSAYTLLSAGRNHGCGLRDDGTVHCWGYQNYGQIGTGASFVNASNSGPEAVYTADLTGTVFTTVQAGELHTCGLRDDHSVWCWGYNSSGQLGVGASIAMSNVPLRVTFP